MSSTDVDVLVAGGGPVGLAAAIECRRRGFDVLVVEPRDAPVDKACGEGVMPTGLGRLRRLGVDPDGVSLRGIRYVDGTGQADAAFADGPGRGIRRTTLHEGLSEAAHAHGVEVVRGRVDEVDQDATSVCAAGVRARWLLAADGLHSTVRESVGLGAPWSGPRRWGLRRHVAVAPWSDLVEVHWSARAEAYVTPVAEDLVGVAILTAEGGRSYDEWLAEFPRLAERVDGRATGDVRGAGPLGQATRGRVSGRVLLVGDAAGYVDALTGEGISVGLASASAAARAIALERPQDYEAEWTSLSRRYRLLTHGLLAASRVPVLRRHAVQVARTPRLMPTLVNALA